MELWNTYNRNQNFIVIAVAHGLHLQDYFTERVLL